jgi:hypothetical protein
VSSDSLSQAEKTLISIEESWELATREEQACLTKLILAEVDCDVLADRVVWVRPQLEFQMLFQLAGGMPSEEGGYYLGNLLSA